MVHFKSCPRCKGDMHINTDMYGSYKECLMCGHMVNLREVAMAGTAVDERTAVKTQAVLKTKKRAA
ncbi:MAG: hypothetical protein FJ312_00710 [SAR202 cluster bacterium]|nr:hypothetical protein [SAR202 cluster bacterium]